MKYPYQIQSLSQYHTDYQRSINDPDGFWAEIASHFSWRKPWNTVRGGNFETGQSTWFDGAQLNITENCIDRHLPDKAHQNAIIFDPLLIIKDYYLALFLFGLMEWRIAVW